jgi:hypothetical protein
MNPNVSHTAQMFKLEEAGMKGVGEKRRQRSAAEKEK